jgi:hypothetical protein
MRNQVITLLSMAEKLIFQCQKCEKGRAREVMMDEKVM